jgi:hypothetical protein
MRFSRFLHFKKLKPQQESNNSLPYDYNKNSSKINDKEKISDESDHILSFACSQIVT